MAMDHESFSETALSLKTKEIFHYYELLSVGDEPDALKRFADAAASIFASLEHLNKIYKSRHDVPNLGIEGAKEFFAVLLWKYGEERTKKRNRISDIYLKTYQTLKKEWYNSLLSSDEERYAFTLAYDEESWDKHINNCMILASEEAQANA